VITVLGTGAWGTTFGKVLADAGNPILLWGRSETVVAEIQRQRTNERYLPGHVLPETVSATANLADAVARADTLVVALPSQVARGVLEPVAHHLKPSATVVSLMKGIELGTDLRMSQVLTEALGVDQDRIVVVSGPNLSREIAAGQPAACVCACEDIERARAVARACATSYFRPYVNDDVVGVELGAAVKNVIALAVGMAAGCGFGDNTKATIITRGLAEITRLAVAQGGDPATMAGLAGMGDLVATCASVLSRNYTLGRFVGQGMSLEEAISATGGTAEGVKSSRSVAHLAASRGVDMPITNAVVAVLYGGLGVLEMTGALLSRPHKDERA